MQVTLDHKDALNATLSIVIEEADYEAKYSSSLREFRKNGSFKGFRKGKTPLGYIRKIYGKAALADAVNDVLQKSVMDYLTEEKVNFIGQPIPAEDQVPIDFDPKDLGSYDFKFDLGLAPEFEIAGLDAKIDRLDVQVEDPEITREMENYQRRLGTQVDTENPIAAGDIIYLNAAELENGEPKADGVQSSFSVQVDDLAETAREDVLGLKTGDTLLFNPLELEVGKDEKFVRKYHLGLEEDDERTFSDSFSGLIERVSRVQPAEINQHFLDKVFGEGKVASEEEGREEIRKGLKGDIDQQADAVLYKSMQQSLMRANTLELPKEFLWRWLNTTLEEEQTEPTDKDKEDFLLDLKWQLLKDKIATDHELEVTNEDIEQGAYRTVYQYIGPYGDGETVQRLVRSVLENKDQVTRISREAMASKVFDILKTTFQVTDLAVSEDEFKEKSKEILES